MINLYQNNTLYTYAFIFQKKYRKKGGYSKTLKKFILVGQKKEDFLLYQVILKVQFLNPIIVRKLLEFFLNGMNQMNHLFIIEENIICYIIKTFLNKKII